MTRALLIQGNAHPQFVRDLARLSGLPVAEVSISTFADGETRVQLEADVLGADAYVVQPTCAPVNERLMVLALIIEAAKGAGAARITALMPYFGYARQDARKAPGEPRSARLAASILGVAGLERIAVLELHTPALESAFQIPVSQLNADEALLPVIRGWERSRMTLVSPDAGALKRAQRYALALGTPLAVITKLRPRADFAVAHQVLGEVRGQDCLIVDDMASTGGTIEAAARTLFEAGAAAVDALFIHAVMAPRALDRMRAAGVHRIVTTDSVPGVFPEDVQVVPVATLFAQALAGGLLQGSSSAESER